MNKRTGNRRLKALAAALAGLFALGAEAGAARSGYIVESHGSTSAAQAVRTVGGRITHELPIVGDVSADLTPAPAATESWNAQE